MSNEITIKEYDKYVNGFVNLGEREKKSFTESSLAYGLNPYLSEIEIVMNRPYITNKGLLKLLNKEGRALTKKETKVEKTGENEYTAEVTMYIAPQGYTAVGFIKEMIGIGLTLNDTLELMEVSAKGVSNPEINRALTDKDNNKSYMSNFSEDLAIKSAENKIIRKVLYIGLPSTEEGIIPEETTKEPINITPDIEALRKEANALAKSSFKDVETAKQVFKDVAKHDSIKTASIEQLQVFLDYMKRIEQ